MKIAFLNLFFDKDLNASEEILTSYPTLRELAKALGSAGQETAVFQRFHTESSLSCEHSDFFFSTDPVPRLRNWAPDIVHLHGLLFPLQTLRLRCMLPRSAAIVAQHHAESPPGHPAALLRRLAFHALDGAIFSAAPIADSWIRSGNLPASIPITSIMEGSTDFTPGPKSESRRLTGLAGTPACLWVGRLNLNKDPLTVLSGFIQLLEHFPDAALYMIFSESEQLDAVRNRIDSSPSLSRSCHLIGRVPHDRMHLYYRSADFFVLGSHHEGSGYALCEALSCGLTPIVTDIPSFRMMTDEGNLGSLWRPGDAGDFARAAIDAISRSPIDPCTIRAFFDSRLSWTAIARDLLNVYAMLLERRRRTRR